MYGDWKTPRITKKGGFLRTEGVEFRSVRKDVKMRKL